MRISYQERGQDEIKRNDVPRTGQLPLNHLFCGLETIFASPCHPPTAYSPPPPRHPQRDETKTAKIAPPLLQHPAGHSSRRSNPCGRTPTIHRRRFRRQFLSENCQCPARTREGVLLQRIRRGVDVVRHPNTLGGVAEKGQSAARRRSRSLSRAKAASGSWG